MSNARIDTCADCGNITAVLNVNTPTNEYMLCGRCQYAQLGDINAGQDWHGKGGLGLAIFNDRTWLFTRQDGLTTIAPEELPELITALQVAQARHAAASAAQERAAVNRAEDGNGVEGWVEA